MATGQSVEYLTDQDRERARGRIKLGKILKRLGDTALGLDCMKAGELAASKLLLDKALPNLASLAVTSSPDLNNIASMNTHDLITMLAAITITDDQYSDKSSDISLRDADSLSKLEPDQNTDNVVSNQQVRGVLGAGSVNGLGGVVLSDAATTLNSVPDDKDIPDVTSEDNDWHVEPEERGSKVAKTTQQTQNGLNYTQQEEKSKDFPTNGTVHIDSKEQNNGGRQEPQRLESNELSPVEGQERGRQSDAVTPTTEEARDAAQDKAHAGNGSSQGQPLTDTPADPLFEMEELRNAMRNKYANSGTGDSPSKGNAPAGAPSCESPVKGSIVQGRGIGQSGKIR